MSSSSNIEWTDATWNPVRGCTKISPGCTHCYAETFAERWRGVAGHPYEHGFDLRLVPSKIADPLRWERSRLVFVNSMSDLFHASVPAEFVDVVAHVIRLSDWHGFQLLTKRSARLEELSRTIDLCPANLIVGVSVEDRKYGIPRIEDLRRARVGRRFLSIEPLLEDLGELDLAGIDWVVVGGESGRGARPLEVAWVRSIREQCLAQEVPFFFKQWGGVDKKRAGRELDDRTWDAMPTLPVSPTPAAKDRHKRTEVVERLAAKFEARPILTQLRRSRGAA